MTVGPVGPVGFTPLTMPSIDATSATNAASSSSNEFSHLLADGLDRLDGLQQRSDSLAVKAATGDLTNIHDYTVAASEATTAVQLSTALRNKALESFSEIMRMSV